MPENYFNEVEVAQQIQKSHDGVVFPAVLTPKPNNTGIDDNPSDSELSFLTEAIKAQKPWLESLLQESGAILFRGFPVISPSDFNDVVEAFGFPEMQYIGGRASRTNVAGRVYTANESPPDQKIPFHQEMCNVAVFPSKIFFFCEVEPGCGGETPIVLGHIIYERMKERHPEFVEQLEEHGLIYTVMLGGKDDPSSLVGRCWQSVFGTNDKSVAEERSVARNIKGELTTIFCRAAELGSKLEWMEDAVKMIMGPLPGIRFDGARQQNIWFNSMAVAYRGPEDAQHKNPVEPITFGDGKPLPADAIRDCCKMLDEECVAIPWQKGDFLLLDNLAVLHSRQPLIKPPRRVLVSICK